MGTGWVYTCVLNMHNHNNHSNKHQHITTTTTTNNNNNNDDDDDNKELTPEAVSMRVWVTTMLKTAVRATALVVHVGGRHSAGLVALAHQVVDVLPAEYGEYMVSIW